MSVYINFAFSVGRFLIIRGSVHILYISQIGNICYKIRHLRRSVFLYLHSRIGW